MQAKECRATDLLTQNKVQFIIPIYQRDYEWTQAQCEQLFKDIVTAGSSKSEYPHFIGSVVYVHDDIYTTSKIKELSVIDGQQRLTTLNLIYLAIYRLAKSLGDSSLSEEIYETYLVNKFTADGEKLKLQQTAKNQKALDHLLSLADPAEFSGFSRLITNFNYFYARINKDNYQLIQDGLQKLMIVEVSLDRERDNAQRIFESLNSTGLELTQADLIRNYILMGLSRRQQERIYNIYWSVIESNAGVEKDNTSKVSDFIRDYLTLTNGAIPNKGKVYLSFKSHFPSANIEDLEPILISLKSLSAFYNKITNPHNESDKDIRRELEYIARLETSVVNPFLMKVYEDYANNVITKPEFLKVLVFVQSYAFRRVIVGLATNALNKVFMNLYDKITQADYVPSLERHVVGLSGTSRIPTNAEVTEALKHKDFYSMRPSTKMYLLSRLENFNNKEFVEINKNSDITIEHIYPQNPNDEWLDDISSADMDALSTKYLHTIANLTLSGNNGSLGNKPFLYKRDLPEKGYLASRLWLNKHLGQLDKWGVKELIGRRKIITERALNVWAYPVITEAPIAVVDTETMVNIFEAGDPYYKKIASATFFDEPLALTTIGKLYTEVVATLFELNPSLFFTTNLAQSLGMSDSRAVDKLIQPITIDDTYFIEGNHDSRAKLDKIKEVLTAFDVEDALFIKYEQSSTQ